MNDFEDTVRQVCRELNVPFNTNFKNADKYHKIVDYYHEITWPYFPSVEQIMDQITIKNINISAIVMGNDYILMIEVLK